MESTANAVPPIVGSLEPPGPIRSRRTDHGWRAVVRTAAPYAALIGSLLALLGVTVRGPAAALQEETVARVAADTTLSKRITTLEQRAEAGVEDTRAMLFMLCALVRRQDVTILDPRCNQPSRGSGE